MKISYWYPSISNDIANYESDEDLPAACLACRQVSYTLPEIIEAIGKSMK